MDVAAAYAHQTIALAGREPEPGPRPSQAGWTLVDAAIWTRAADECGWPRETGESFQWGEWA